MTGYVGVAGVPSTAFLTRSEMVRPVLADIARRGLLYLDGGAPGALATVLAPSVGLDRRGADVMVDAAADESTMGTALSQAEAMARANGIATALIGVDATNSARVQSYVRGLEGRGFALVPFSAARGVGAAAGRVGVSQR